MNIHEILGTVTVYWMLAAMGAIAVSMTVFVVRREIDETRKERWR